MPPIKSAKPKSSRSKSRESSAGRPSKNSNRPVSRKELEPTGLIVLKKRTDHWRRADEILNQLALTGLKDNCPPKLLKTVRTKLVASRKALQLRADIKDVATPLLELADIVEEQGLQTGDAMNKQLQAIRGCLSQANKESFQEDAVESTPRPKDAKGVHMKKLLSGARGFLDQMTQLNELQINLTNSIEGMLKNSGYLLENRPLSVHKKDTAPKKLDKPPMFSYSWKKAEGVLDHLMRVCQRPCIPIDLQGTILSKVSAARKSLLMKEDPLKISRHLHEMIDMINIHGFHSGEALNSRLEGMTSPWENNTETGDGTTTGGTLTGAELRKALDQTNTCISYLSDLNELKMIIRTAADLILQGGHPPYMAWMETTTDIGQLLRLVDMTALPTSLKTAVKETLLKARPALCSPGGQEALIGPLEVLSWSLKEQAPDFVSRACDSLTAAANIRNKRK